MKKTTKRAIRTKRNFTIAKRFRVGVTVKVKANSWYSRQKKDSDGNIIKSKSVFNKEMKKWCGRKMTITSKKGNYYTVKENGWRWNDFMFEKKIAR